MTDDIKPINATPYQWRDPSTIPTRAESLRESNAEIARLRDEIERLREALSDVLVYCPDYMHGMPRKYYEAYVKQRA